MANRLSTIATRTGDEGTTGLGDGTRTRTGRRPDRGDGRGRRVERHAGRAAGRAAAGPGSGGPAGDPARPVRSGRRTVDPGAPDDRRDAGGAAGPSAWRNYNANLPRLAEFILPGGARTAALAHVCRTVCRRAERALVALAQAGGPDPVGPAARQYINRLSDLLFVLARVLNRAGGSDDVLWRRDRGGL